jgi:hypothetical protein
MLGTLRMNINACIDEYRKMAPKIFPVENIINKKAAIFIGTQRFDPTPLEEAVKTLVRERLGQEDKLFKFESSRDNRSPRCKV